jgi:hypothetical protein
VRVRCACGARAVRVRCAKDQKHGGGCVHSRPGMDSKGEEQLKAEQYRRARPDGSLMECCYTNRFAFVLSGQMGVKSMKYKLTGVVTLYLCLY